MKKLRLFWLVFPPFLAIIIFTIGVFLLWANRSIHKEHVRNKTAELESVLALVDKSLANPAYANDPDWQIVCKEMVARTHVRITIMDTHGIVLGDSHENPLRMESHALRPEVLAALSGKDGLAQRTSHTLNVEMAYLARKVHLADNKELVVRVSQQISKFEDQLLGIARDFMLLSGVWFLFIFTMVYFLARSISQPIEIITSKIQRLAQGHLDEKISIQGSKEIQSLAETINSMAGVLDEKISTIIKQKNEQGAAFASMKEGIIAMDVQGNIIEMNKSARVFLQCDGLQVVGTPFSLVVRNTHLIQMFEQLKVSKELEADLEILEPEHRIFKVRGTQILGQENSMIGLLFVLDDMTKLRKLEQMRKQFVANVSHELKTPLTSIKGYVETLLNSPSVNVETTKRFMEKIEVNANRLNSLIEDLLTLSRVEQEGLSPDELTMVNIKKLLENTLSELQPDKFPHLKFAIDCPIGLTNRAHQLLLQQAVFNLVENAAKYSDKEGSITIKAFPQNGHTVIQVVDQGPGIESKHIPHLLERFYRVDKARSRAKGGTGLGLSIVKHIVQAHFGKVLIESQLGVGSTFTISIPNEIHINKK